MTLDQFIAQHSEAILVRVDEVKGSAPRDAGAFMLVAEQAFWGTIGGGELEYQALRRAREILSARNSGAQKAALSLGPEIGQCCGGRVSLSFLPLDDAVKAQMNESQRQAISQQPHVYCFGLGHFGSALLRALAPLPFQVFGIDGRDHEVGEARKVAADLEKQDAHISITQLPVPEAIVQDAPMDAAYVIATHDHGLDFLIASAALKRRDARYVGLIGSATKRARFRKYHLGEGGKSQDLDRLTCPIGGDLVPDKRPSVIAALVAAELLQTYSSNRSDNQ